MRKKLEILNDVVFNQISKDEISTVRGGAIVCWHVSETTYVTINTDYIIVGAGDNAGESMVVDAGD